jgi:formylglycine-generating enzyme required for sulfatase activity
VRSNLKSPQRWVQRATKLLLLVPFSGAVAAQEITWREQYYNPSPQAEDLVLPLPCGGAMAFRPVEIPAESLLGDRRVTLGGSDDRFNFSENYRRDYVAGGFSANGVTAGREFYLGKYEVTTDQYRAATEDQCVQPTNTGRLPKASVTWSEAIAFSVRYTGWLYANAKKSLPSEDGTLGFLRLPTEAEWEYAARGGAVVSESEFLRPLPPLTGELREYVWYGSPDSSSFKPQLIGLLKPNPLGLHDMLGNVGEMMLEAYRLNKISRLHGQAGGVIVKGGDFLTPADAVRRAQREEMNPFDENGVRRLETVGFRLLIGAPTLTSPSRLEAIKQQWANLPESESALADTERLEDPIDEINLLVKTTEDKLLRERLTGLRAVIQSNIAARNEQRDRAARSLLRTGVLLAVRVADLQKILEARQLALKNQVELDNPNPALVQILKRSVDETADKLRFDIGYYKDTVADVVQDYSLSVLDPQIDVLKRELTEQGRRNMADYVEKLRKHLVEFRATGEIASQAILANLK